MPTETEIKLRLKTSVDAARHVIEAAGYSASDARVLEADQLFDFEDLPLRRSGRLLRVRTIGDTTILTYKGPAEPGIHKSREEIETEIADGPAFVAILKGLGYLPTFRYEKYRTTFRAAGAPGIITLDETPIGVFLELEGPGNWIDETAKKLGFSADEYITASYAALYSEHRRANPKVPADMVF
jgi:adenylate cyclase, class 2